MQKPRGTRDFYGAELENFHFVYTTISAILKRFGFEEIKTPVFEYSELFKNHESKELFSMDRYSLRPEGTIGVIRSVLENGLIQTRVKPIKLFYFGDMFRHERPQKDRYRQFTQLGVEVFGGDDRARELEIQKICFLINEKFGLNLSLYINHLGTKTQRSDWSLKLKEYYSRNEKELRKLGIWDRSQDNPIRLLDSKELIEHPLAKNAPELRNKASDQVLREFQQNLLELSIPSHLAPTLVRGLEYYTGLVYEWKDGDLTIIGGGQYNDLISELSDGEVQINSSGFAIGIDRLLNRVPRTLNSTPQCIYFGSLVGFDLHLFKLLMQLKSTIFINDNWTFSSMGKHMSLFEKGNYNLALIFGEREREGGFLTVIDKQNNRSQLNLSFSDIASRILSLLDS